MRTAFFLNICHFDLYEIAREIWIISKILKNFRALFVGIFFLNYVPCGVVRALIDLKLLYFLSKNLVFRMVFSITNV